MARGWKYEGEVRGALLELGLVGSRTTICLTMGPHRSDRAFRHHRCLWLTSLLQGGEGLANLQILSRSLSRRHVSLSYQLQEETGTVFS